MATALTVGTAPDQDAHGALAALRPPCRLERLVAKVPLGRVHVSPAGRSLARARSHALPGRPGALRGCIWHA